ncbi:MAG: response regulator transcription factor [Candidatus Onthovivens sp.]|nr:response regulator transcription factor [Candidatus Onthovivens sp.]
MEMKTVLLLYSNKDNFKDIKSFLNENNYKIIFTNDVYEGISICIKSIVDIVVIDFSSNTAPGLEQIDIFRKYNSYIPILFISNRSDIETKVIAFNSGANDFLVKPFNNYELIVRMNNLTRFNKKNDEEIFTNGDLKINFTQHQVYIGNKEIHLTNIEYKILVLLANNLDKTLSYDYIIEHIWGKDGQDQNGLRVFISNIRNKLKTDKKVSSYFRTKTNVGYRMKKV